jgi:hypothetical protein
MTGIRFLVAFIMTFTTMWSFSSGEDFFSGAGDARGDLPMFKMSGLKVLIPTTIFALMLNSCVPSVVQGLESKHDIR